MTTGCRHWRVSSSIWLCTGWRDHGSTGVYVVSFISLASSIDQLDGARRVIVGLEQWEQLFSFCFTKGIPLVSQDPRSLRSHDVTVADVRDVLHNALQRFRGRERTSGRRRSYRRGMHTERRLRILRITGHVRSAVGDPLPRILAALAAAPPFRWGGAAARLWGTHSTKMMCPSLQARWCNTAHNLCHVHVGVSV